MRNKGRMPTLTTSIQNVLYILANAVGQEKKTGIQFRKKEVKLHLFTKMAVENPVESK